MSVRTDTEMLLNSFRVNNHIRFDFKTLSAETERERLWNISSKPAFDVDIHPRGF